MRIRWKNNRLMCTICTEYLIRLGHFIFYKIFLNIRTRPKQREESIIFPFSLEKINFSIKKN